MNQAVRNEMNLVYDRYMKPLMDAHEIQFQKGGISSTLNETAKMMATNDRVSISNNFERVGFCLNIFINYTLLLLLHRRLLGKFSFLFLPNLMPRIGSKRKLPCLYSRLLAIW